MQLGDPLRETLGLDFLLYGDQECGSDELSGFLQPHDPICPLLYLGSVCPTYAGYLVSWNYLLSFNLSNKPCCPLPVPGLSGSEKPNRINLASAK